MRHLIIAAVMALAACASEADWPPLRASAPTTRAAVGCPADYTGAADQLIDPDYQGCDDSDLAATTTEPTTTTTEPTTPTTEPTKRTVAAPPTATTTAPPPPSAAWPGPTNTGVPAGTVLTPHTGNLVVSTPGTVIQNRHVQGGQIVVNAANVTIRRSKITGSATQGIRIESAAARLVVEDVEIDCLNGGGSNGMAQIFGNADQNITVHRVNVHHCENGFDIDGGMTIRDSYVHDLFAGGTAHTDGAQIWPGARNVLFEGNVLEAPPPPNGTSAIIAAASSGPQFQNIRIEHNILKGGAYTLYCPGQPSVNVRIVNNRFVPGAFGPADCDRSNIAQWSGNVNHVTGAPI